MKKFVLFFSLITFISLSVAFTFTDDPKKSNCPYLNKTQSSECPYLNGKSGSENSDKSNNSCPFMDGKQENSKKSIETDKKQQKKLETIKT